jgi:hypothetical protein
MRNLRRAEKQRRDKSMSTLLARPQWQKPGALAGPRRYAPSGCDVRAGVGLATDLRLTRDGRCYAAAKHRKALGRYQYEIAQRRAGLAHKEFEFLGVRMMACGYQWAPGKRLMMPFMLIASGGRGGSAGGGGGGEEFDSLVPSVQVSDITELLAEYATAVAGTIIGALAGSGSTYLHVASPGYRDNEPAFDPGASGSSGSPIIVVGQYDPTQMADPLTDATRTEFVSGSGAYNGSDSHPVIGCNSHSYVRFINIVANEANSITKLDNGPLYMASATAVMARRCVLQGVVDALLASDNHCGFRIGEGDTIELGHTIEECRITGFKEGFGVNAAGGILYGGRLNTIRGNDISDCTTGLYEKGSGDTGANYNYGTVEYNLIHNVTYGMRLQDTDGSNDLLVQHNVVRDFSGFGIGFTSSGGSGSTTRNIVLYRNTIIAEESTANLCWYIKAIDGVGNEFRENLLAVFGTTNQGYIDGGEYSDNNFAAMDRNGYYGSTATNKFAWNGGNQTNLAQWQSATGAETSSDILVSDPFVNYAGGDLTVTGAAATMGAGGGAIGADWANVGL